MEHHHHHHDHKSNLGLAFFLNVIFTVIEIVGGIYTNSLAIISDAVHDLGDSLSLGLAWYLEKISDKPGDRKFTYGYKRFSVLGAIITSVILITGSVFIIYSSIPRLFNPQPVESNGMIFLAILGIVFNGLGFWKTHHGHSHNEQMASLHLLEDLIGWVAVLVGAVLIHFFGWIIIDPILSVLIASFILYNVLRSLKKTLNIILQGTPSNVNAHAVKDRLLDFEEISRIHDLHLWTLDGLKNILTVHLVITQNLSMTDVFLLKKKIHTAMQELSIHHCTIEVERPGEECDHKDQTNFI